MDPALKSIVGESPKIEKVMSGLSSAGAPVYSRIGYLLVSDVGAGKILKWSAGSVSTFREKSNGANGITFDHQGRLLAAENARVTRTEKDGRVTVLAPNEAMDLVYAIDGNTYFIGGAAIYRIKPKGGATVVSRECERPMGVALSPNQQQLLVADGAQRNVRVFDIAGDGTLKAGRVFGEVKPGITGGLKTDESGNVWLAAADGIRVLDKQGKILGTIAIPEPPNNLNWGEGFRNVFVTAKTSVYKIDARTNGARTF